MKNKIKRPNLTKLKTKVKVPPVKIPKALQRRKAPEERLKEAFANVPKITNETIAEHREEVLSSARKYIYPLKHSRGRIVIISSSITVLAIVLFLVYIGLSLYSFQSTNSFIYGVSKVVPFPVAKVGGRWVSYDSYLFEIRRYMHYYQTQQHVNFSSAGGAKQLNVYKKQAMSEVITDAYVSELAQQYGVTVSNQQVNNEVSLVQSQNRLGDSQQELAAVLNNFWGWSINDFKRELRLQMLQQAVAAKLDVGAQKLAQSTLAAINKGGNFATLASEVSDDISTKSNGGQFPSLISRNDPNISPQITQELFRLKPGQVSGIINTGYTLEILKVLSVEGNKIQAAHISFNLNPISTYIAPLERTQKPQYFIHV